MIVQNQIVRTGNIQQGHADVFIEGIGKIGFVSYSCSDQSWSAYRLDGSRVDEPWRTHIKRDHAMAALAKDALKATEVPA